MENSIELRNLTKHFGSKTALDGLTMRMEGGVFGLLGRKGAGKSTLLRILATLLRADAGEALVCGVPAKRAGAVRAVTGYLPENFSIYGNMRVREGMDYLGASRGWTRARARRAPPSFWSAWDWKGRWTRACASSPAACCAASAWRRR